MSLRTYDGAVCFITGGASGIGAALGRELVRRGATVVLADRQEEAAAGLAQEILQAGGKAEPVALDVRDAEAFEAAVDGAVATHGRLDYLFNNAGIGVGGTFEEHSIDDWKYIIDVNVMGVLYGCRAAYRHMREQGYGHIVNTASMAGQMPTPMMSSYGTTKHAVVGMTRSLRAEAVDYGVRVSAFCPGVIRTNILDQGGAFGRVVGRAGVFETSDEDAARAMDVGRFASKALDQVAQNREIIVLPTWWRAIWAMDRLSLRLSERFMRLTYRRMKAQMEKAAARRAGS